MKIIDVALTIIRTSQLKDRFPGIFQGDYFSQIVYVTVEAEVKIAVRSI